MEMYGIRIFQTSRASAPNRRDEARVNQSGIPEGADGGCGQPAF